MGHFAGGQFNFHGEFLNAYFKMISLKIPRTLVLFHQNEEVLLSNSKNVAKLYKNIQGHHTVAKSKYNNKILTSNYKFCDKEKWNLF